MIFPTKYKEIVINGCIQITTVRTCYTKYYNYRRQI